MMMMTKTMKINWMLLVLLSFILGCAEKNGSTPEVVTNPETLGNVPSTQWHKGYGTENEEHVHEIMQTSDGGFLAIGQTDEGTGESSDLLLIKIDSNGALLWLKKIGTEQVFDVGICIDEVADGYLVGGGVYKNDQERYLAKIGFAGDIIWERTFDHPGEDMIRGIALAENGDILLTGYKGHADGGYVFIADDSEGFVMRTDPEGALIWEKSISTSQGAKIRTASDGFIICSTHWMNDPDHSQDFYLIKLDGEGNKIWARTYGGDSDEHCYDCDVASDGGVILGGHTRSPSYGVINWDFLLMKVDASGNEEWHRTFGQPRGYDPEFIHDEAYGVRQTPDGGYILVGGTGDEYAYSASGHPRGSSDTWMVYAVKVADDGELKWEEVYGSARYDDAGEYLGLTKDGGFIIGTDSDIGAENFAPNNFGFLKIK